MKVSYVEGLANHNGLESCGAARDDDAEALTGGRTGRVLSREIHALLRERQVLRGADAVEDGGRQYRVHRQRKVYLDPATGVGSMHGWDRRLFPLRIGCECARKFP